MSFHTQSQFGRRNGEKEFEGASNGDSVSQTATVYTKPFTVQSNKGSEKTKMQQSVASKAATEMVKGGKVVK